MGTADKENGRGLFSRLKFSSSAKAASPSPPASRAASHDGRTAPSRLPAAPPQAARGPAAAGGSHPQLWPLGAAPGQAAASTPRNFARTPQSARGPAPQPTAASRHTAQDGSLTARRVPKLGAPPMPTVSPGCSYKEALTTPRMAASSKLPGPPPPAAGQAQQATGAAAQPPGQPAATPGSHHHHQQQQQQRQEHPQQQEQALADLQEQGRLLVQQQARASHEQEHMQQQISRLEASMAAQHAELQGRLAALAVLGERREALADHLASINLLIAQVKAAEEARSAELSELELALRAAQAAAEAHRLQAAAGEQKAAAARASLLGIMQAVAQTLRLPALAASIQQELSSSSSGESGAQPAAAAAAPQQAGPAARPVQPQQQAQLQAQQQLPPQARRPACPKSPSEAGSQCYATPPGSIAGGEESGSDAEEDYRDGSSSSGSESGSPRAASPQPTCSSGRAGEITARRDSLTGGAVGEAAQRRAPPLPPLRLAGVGQPADAGSAAPGSARGPPSSRIPGVSLVSPLPAAGGKPAAAGAAAGAGRTAAPSGRVSPQVLLRLHSISSKLEAALADQALLDVDAA